MAVLPSEVTSSELIRCVNRFDVDGPRGIVSSGGDELDEDIDRAQQLLGAAFGQNLVDAASARRATGVLIVPGGVLATLPLTTAHVRGEHGPRPISEAVTVSVTPSAYVHQVCRRRIAQRVRLPRLLVCAGDPGSDDPQRALPWSRSEVRAISRLYGAEQRTSVGADASRDFLRRYAGRASHLHLSLHGFSDVAEAMQSGVVMADGPMTAAEFRESTELTAQVVVVSACESGRISIGQAPNEFRGLPFALIACGAAAVVASLWPVSDLPTSLLMVRFHEELIRLESSRGPGAELVGPALGVAQAWLRSATYDDVDRFRARHGLFRRERPHRVDDRGAPRDPGTVPGADRRTSCPFGAPRHWAAFVAIG